GSRNTPHPPRRTVGPAGSTGGTVTLGGVTQRCRPAGSRPDLVNPLHRLAVGREQQAGAVVDDDLDSAVVVLDAQLVVLDRVARVGVIANLATPSCQTAVRR